MCSCENETVQSRCAAKMLKSHCMFGSQPNVTQTASWQQPCHGGVYPNSALLFTAPALARPAAENSHCGTSPGVYVGNKYSEGALLCERSAHTQKTIDKLRVHSLNSQPALLCVLLHPPIQSCNYRTYWRHNRAPKTGAHAHARARTHTCKERERARGGEREYSQSSLYT